jgi:NAD(P)H dehydrogenase (quinone)
MGLNVPFSRSEGLPSIHKAAKQGSEKIGLVINTMQHGVIYVGTGVLPAVIHPESMSSTLGPGPEVQNRLGSFVGAMSASFQVQPPDAPPPGDIATGEAYGERVAGITLRLAK